MEITNPEGRRSCSNFLADTCDRLTAAAKAWWAKVSRMAKKKATSR
jgi:hypothetical protein